MHEWIIERVTNEVDLEGVLEVDRASFVNGWPRQLYVKELQNTQVARIYSHMRTMSERPFLACTNNVQQGIRSANRPVTCERTLTL